MNIILHCDEYAPHWGPCTVRMKVFSDTFQRLGDNVTILASATNLEGGKAEENTIYCPAIKMKKKSTMYRLGSNLSFAISSFFKSVGAGKADVVISTSPPILISMLGWLIARCKGAKLVYDVRDIWPDVAIEMGSFSEDGFYCKVFRFIANFMFKHADAVTTVSQGKLNKIKAKLPAGQQQKVWLVENGLDEKFLEQQENPEVVETYNLNKKFTCVYVGNIGLAQGLSHLLDLAETVDKEKYQFLLFGNGAEKQALEQSATRRGLTHVHFCGIVNSNTVYSILKHASMTYIPLVNANLKDSIPTKTYEALGVGCPVLMVAEGDAPKLVEECRLGLSLSPNEIERLPSVFNTFCEHYEQIRTNKEYARNAVLQNHSRQRIAEKFEWQLQVLVGKNSTVEENQGCKTI